VFIKIMGIVVSAATSIFELGAAAGESG
jgi:hypothetical protein